MSKITKEDIDALGHLISGLKMSLPDKPPKQDIYELRDELKHKKPRGSTFKACAMKNMYGVKPKRIRRDIIKVFMNWCEANIIYEQIICSGYKDWPQRLETAALDLLIPFNVDRLNVLHPEVDITLKAISVRIQQEPDVLKVYQDQTDVITESVNYTEGLLRNNYFPEGMTRAKIFEYLARPTSMKHLKAWFNFHFPHKPRVEMCF